MRAFQFVEWQRPGELRDVPVPEPGPGQVLIKVGGAGACHSDLHIMELPAGEGGVSASANSATVKVVEPLILWLDNYRSWLTVAPEPHE